MSLSRQEEQWVHDWLSGELHIEENPEIARRVMDKMFTELRALRSFVNAYAVDQLRQEVTGE